MSRLRSRLRLCVSLVLLSGRLLAPCSAFVPPNSAVIMRQRTTNSLVRLRNCGFTRDERLERRKVDWNLRMAVTPVGPFCPFRSSATLDMEPRMENLNTATPEFATEMARIQLDMESGNPPDKERLIRVADGIDSAVDDWENLLTRLRLSNDFQTREYAKLTQAHLDRHGQTAEGIASMMRWQSECMRALANNTPPPMPPPDMDLMKMVQQAKDEKAADGGRGSPSMTAMARAEKITSTPFTGKEAAFETPMVREEYEKLCKDHMALIDMGSGYAGFDPSGKIAYLDEIEKIEDRWDVFFARFSLLGALNQEFVGQCNQFLESMGLDEKDFRELLKKTHEIMRADAEKERNAMVY